MKTKTEESTCCPATQLNRALLNYKLVWFAGVVFSSASFHSSIAASIFTDVNWTALGSGMNDWVNALAVSGSNVYAGGYFTTAGGTSALGIAKWDGRSWSAMGSGIGSVTALAVSGREVYAASDHVAKWNGSNWTTLSWGTNGTGSHTVFALAVLGRDVYAGGAFGTAAGTPTNPVAKWNGSTWSPVGSDVSGVVDALAVSGNDLYAAGAFGAGPAFGIAKWDGSSWSALGSGVNTIVYALAVSGSNVYAGGRFTTAGGSAANYIAKWDGSNWSPLGSGVDYWVTALAVSGNDVYAGGEFERADGNPANYIAKWNGSSWSPLGSGMGAVSFPVRPYVFALAVSGNDLYAGGEFTTAGGKVAPYIARAYLERPALSIFRFGADVTISWPSFYEGFVLQQNADAVNTNGWSNANYPLTTNGAIKRSTVPITPGKQFFRLIGN